MKSIKVNYGVRCAAEPAKGHNRWHCELSAALEADPGEEVELETRDALDGQVTAASSADDRLKIDMSVVHPLTGPVFVKGAEPGDLLEVDIRELKPAAWGFTIQLPGFGFLRDEFPDPYIVKWKSAVGSRHLGRASGVRVRDGSFMGTIGVAPSEELRREMLRREENLRERGGFVLPPEAAAPCPRASRSRRKGCAQFRDVNGGNSISSN